MDRIEACKDQSLPATYRKYLDTSFLGPEKSVPAGNVNYSYHRFGPLSTEGKSGRPLVLITGLGCTKSTWTPELLKTLAATREVIIFDNRGSGRSSDKQSLKELSIEGFASSTLELLEALDIKQPDMLGWSMGGLISLQLATHHSEAVNRFIIVNSAAPNDRNREMASKEWPIHLWEGQLNPTPFFPDTAVGNAGLCRYVKLHEAMPKDSVTVDVVKAQRQALKDAYQGGSDVHDRLKDIRNPVLIVVGTYYGEGPNSYDLLEHIPTSMIVGFSDAAHGAIFQYAEQAGTAIVNFLDSSQDEGEAPMPRQ